ncbi:cation:proton antiporter [Kushneria indalinina]|uniref:Sodium/proton antiporter (CPA1 family) n=1 Tax=Kushneria indalinina DSM 14324 TaxID=1122140 RepID=A0A3D9DYP5_9GAMM|nr:cation:proton antiporter [Kushneria indalinina]REC95912.1 sodium/proton antiporter (CPA1 family) [Kushneria indalinina DSM 14324]
MLQLHWKRLFIPSMNQPSTARMTHTVLILAVCISCLWLINGLMIQKIRQWYATEVQFALLAGVIVGPVTHLVPIDSLGDVTTLMEWACRITMAMALSSAALQMERRFLEDYSRPLAVIVIGGMVLMAAFTTVLIQITMATGWALAFLLGWILTPTDPVVTATVVQGDQAKQLIPAPMRHAITYESGINDGLASPMVMLAMALWLSITQGAPLEGMHWLLMTVGYENLACIGAAYALGLIAGKALQKAHAAGWMSQSTLLPFALAFTLLLLFGLHMIGMNAIIGVFIGNLGLSHTVTENEDLQQEEMQSTLERLFTIPVFFLLGIVLPWQGWLSLGWLALLATVLIVFLRRLPALLLLSPLLGPLKGIRTAAWLGWIGPLGVAALLYALEVREKADLELAWPLVTLVVVASVVIHGSSSIVSARAYARHTDPDNRS